jgi:transcriptional regulator with XRE-family HTH domain
MPNPLKAFGATVRALRKERGLTQEALAELCKRHPVYISELERGIKNPSLDSILRLCRALRIAPGTLMDLTFQPADQAETLTKELLRLLAGKDAKTIKTLLEMARVFLSAEHE